MKANRIRICGRKTMTLPTPPITPSANKLVSGPGGSRCWTLSASQSLPASMASMSGRAPVKIA